MCSEMAGGGFKGLLRNNSIGVENGVAYVWCGARGSGIIQVEGIGALNRYVETQIARHK